MLGINLHFFFELYFQTMAAVLVRFEAGQNTVLDESLQAEQPEHNYFVEELLTRRSVSVICQRVFKCN